MRHYLYLLALVCVGCGDDTLPAGRDAGPPVGTDAGRVGGMDAGVPVGMDGGPPVATDAGPPAGTPTDCAMVTCYFIREGAAGAADGSDWDDAFVDLPDSLERGAVYFFADGSYGSPMLDDAESGTQSITLRKAIESDHGTPSGWMSAYGDAQASFPGMVLVTDYWIIDGATRDESDWQDTARYGFRFTGDIQTHTINFFASASHVTFRYVDVGGPPGSMFSTSLPRSGFELAGFDDTAMDWTISRSHAHHVYMPVMIAGASSVTVEHSWLGPNWSKETIRGQIRASQITIRYNIFKDGCQGTPGDPTAGGCTAQIAMWDSDTPGDYDGSRIYGNVIWTTEDTGHSDACILVGGDEGVSAAGVPALDVLVYNNTFVGIQNGTCSIRFPSAAAGTAARNNLWFGLGAGVSTGCEAEACSHNENAMSDATLFVDAAGGDFHLARETSAGMALPAPFDRDMDGRTRGATGVWDLGAYER